MVPAPSTPVVTMPGGGADVIVVARFEVLEDALAVGEPERSAGEDASLVGSGLCARLGDAKRPSAR